MYQGVTCSGLTRGCEAGHRQAECTRKGGNNPE